MFIISKLTEGEGVIIKDWYGFSSKDRHQPATFVSLYHDFLEEIERMDE
jgi:hypothetical protein